MLNKIIKLLLAIQGKGYGAASIRGEVGATKKLVGSGGVFIDAGANKGIYTEELIRQYGNSITELHLFEPSKELVKKYLNYSDPRIRVNNIALSNHSGSASLHKVSGSPGLSSLTKRRLDHFDMQMSEAEVINTITLDDYVAGKNISHISLLKMDIEGHEFDVLNGAIGCLQENRIGCIQFEFGGANIDTRVFFQDFWYLLVENFGFKMYRITPFGIDRVNGYSELDEIFLTTNYLAVNCSACPLKC